MPEPIVLVEPILEPITLTDAKQQCNIDASDDGQDTLIESYIATARDYVEWRAGITVHQKKYRLNLDCWPSGAIILPLATPLIEVESIIYVDSSETPGTWSASEYVVSAGSKRAYGRVAPKCGYSYPSFTPSPLDPIRVVFTGGIATASPMAEAEEAVKQAVRELVAGMFDNRESEAFTDRASIAAVARKYGVEAMIARLRVSYAF